MVISVAPIIAAAIAGGAGGGIANVAMSPVSGGANMLQSYWYGAGLILGERDMYTFHWEKIKQRLENGEDYLSVLESEMNPAITAISAYSLQVMEKTVDLYKKAGVNFVFNLIEDLLNPFFSGDREGTDNEPLPDSDPVPPPPVPDTKKELTELELRSLNRGGITSDALLKSYRGKLHEFTDETQQFIVNELIYRGISLDPNDDPVTEPTPDLDNVLDDLTFSQFKKTITQSKYPGLNIPDYNNLQNATSLSGWWNYLNSEWAAAKKYIDDVIASGGSQNSPQFIQTLARKNMYERLIADANTVINNNL